MKFPKLKILRDSKYLRFVSSLPCLTCGIQDGTVVGHHLKRNVQKKRKSGDNKTIPLCFLCHTGPKGVELHGNETVWFKKNDINDAMDIADFLYECYLNNAYHEAYDSIIKRFL